MMAAAPGAPRTYDLDLHGVVGVRLEEATPADLARVRRQLGLAPGRLARDPDIVIRFVERAPSGPLTYVGVAETGFDGDGFFVLGGAPGRRAAARLPFDQLGQRPQIICERAMPAVPHLVAIINLTALAKGILPLHASAFVLGGHGVLVTGWSKSGKTEALLAGIGDQVRYVGDEWVYLTPDGGMFGLPEPIRLWAWHFERMPELLRTRPRAERWRLAAWRAASAATRGWSNTRLPGAAVAGRAAPVLGRQACLRIPPAELFGAGLQPGCSMDAVVLLVSHASDTVVVSDAGPTEVSERMAASLAEERAPFMAHYRQFRYAYPDRSSTLVEAAAAREAELLSMLFDARPAAKLAHPYPCDLGALGRAVVEASGNLTDRPAATNRAVAG